MDAKKVLVVDLQPSFLVASREDCLSAPMVVYLYLSTHGRLASRFLELQSNITGHAALLGARGQCFETFCWSCNSVEFGKNSRRLASEHYFRVSH